VTLTRFVKCLFDDGKHIPKPNIAQFPDYIW
jgi:hypothetical protein